MGGKGYKAVRFLKRGRGVVDAWVGDVLVGTLRRVGARSEGRSAITWTALPLGEPEVEGLTLSEARVILRLSRRASELSGLFYPEPTPDRGA